MTKQEGWDRIIDHFLDHEEIHPGFTPSWDSWEVTFGSDWPEFSARLEARRKDRADIALIRQRPENVE